MKKYLLISIIALFSILIYNGINTGYQSSDMHSTVSDYSTQTVEAIRDDTPKDRSLSFGSNPNYEDKNEFEEWVHSDTTKIFSLFLILVGATLLTKFSMRSELIKIAFFSGVYFGTTIALINNMIFISYSNNWCLQFLMEYQLIGLFLGLLSGGNAILMIKYKKQILTPILRTFTFIVGIF